MDLGDWGTAVRHFEEYFPSRVREWVVASNPVHHSKIIANLATALSVKFFLNFGYDTPEEFKKIATVHRYDSHVGFLEFLCFGDTETNGYRYGASLMEFAKWPRERLRLCFDITDHNFTSLFIEPRKSVISRADLLGEVVRTSEDFRIVLGGLGGITFSVSHWNPQLGVKAEDYVLPVGELEARPTNVTGSFEFQGWIVGSIPFGVKYGCVGPGNLKVSVKDNRISEISGSNEELVKDLRMAIRLCPELQIVSEIGIGLSGGASHAARNQPIGCLWHERMLGAHLGFGAFVSGPKEMRRARHHIDMVFSSGEITRANGETIFQW